MRESAAMPTYVYETTDESKPVRHFEIQQSMKDEPLKKHPETGEPCRRVLSAPNAPRTWTDAHAKAATSDSSLERKGFTKYVKGEGGKYKKLFGGGPDAISKPPGN